MFQSAPRHPDHLWAAPAATLAPVPYSGSCRKAAKVRNLTDIADLSQCISCNFMTRMPRLSLIARPWGTPRMPRRDFADRPPRNDSQGENASTSRLSCQILQLKISSTSGTLLQNLRSRRASTNSKQYLDRPMHGCAKSSTFARYSIDSSQWWSN